MRTLQEKLKRKAKANRSERPTSTQGKVRRIDNPVRVCDNSMAQSFSGVEPLRLITGSSTNWDTAPDHKNILLRITNFKYSGTFLSDGRIIPILVCVSTKDRSPHNTTGRNTFRACSGPATLFTALLLPVETTLGLWDTTGSSNLALWMAESPLHELTSSTTATFSSVFTDILLGLLVGRT